VAREFLDKPETEDWTFAGVVKNVETDQTSVQFLISSVIGLPSNKLLHFVIEIRYIATCGLLSRTFDGFAKIEQRAKSLRKVGSASPNHAASARRSLVRVS